MNTATRERVQSRTEDAARVARKFLGDLQALERLYKIGAPDYLGKMAHDLEVGLARSCIGQVQLCFFPGDSHKPRDVFQYAVSTGGALTASPHSGRFVFDPSLRDCRFTMRITPSNSKVWEALKADGSLAISWTQAPVLDMSGLVATDDGGYVAGDIALLRSKYTRAS
jgi:hypothetical protein